MAIECPRCKHLTVAPGVHDGWDVGFCNSGLRTEYPRPSESTFDENFTICLSQKDLELVRRGEIDRVRRGVVDRDVNWRRAKEKAEL